jgi:precorrin-2 dehydrogenase/sirohydrochlorin ferrochelatase
MKAPARYPLFLDLTKRKCVVVGGGVVAARKVRGLLRCGAPVTVIAPEVSKRIAELARKRRIVLKRRKFRSADLRGASLAVGATDDATLNEKIAKQGRSQGALVNIVDQPELCDFFLPAVLIRGRLQIAVSTGGGSPYCARLIRDELYERYNKGYGEFVEEMARIRETVIAAVPRSVRARVFGKMAGADIISLFVCGKRREAKRKMRRIVREALCRKRRRI